MGFTSRTSVALRHDGDAVATAVRDGDKAAFSELADRYRHELEAHCYRMLGSVEDSRDAVQETYLRAWRRRRTFEGRASFRAWVYRIATNACLDTLQRRRRPPITDELDAGPTSLEQIRSTDPEPDAVVASKETVELVLLAAIQQLTPKQQAALVLRDVLGWPAKDAASQLESSVPSVNSALQRARRTLRKRLPMGRLLWAPESDPSHKEGNAQVRHERHQECRE